jgi:hypothetical protein
MNIKTSLGLAAAGLLATIVSGVVPGGAAAQAASPEWKTERGNVLECQGEAHGLRVWTSVYENHRYGNVVQVVIGDPDDGKGNSKHTDEKLLVDGDVLASVKVDGKRALVEGAAERHGARTKVYEQFDDAGFLIKTRGFHRPLLTDMGFRYAGTYVPLVCDTAFYYDLEVKKVPIT